LRVQILMIRGGVRGKRVIGVVVPGMTLKCYGSQDGNLDPRSHRAGARRRGTRSSRTGLGPPGSLPLEGRSHQRQCIHVALHIVHCVRGGDPGRSGRTSMPPRPSAKFDSKDAVSAGLALLMARRGPPRQDRLFVPLSLLSMASFRFATPGTAS